MGPSGLPPSFTTFRHFFPPILVCTVVLRPQHRGRRPPLLHSRAVHAWCHQWDLGATRLVWVLPAGPGWHHWDLTAASVTWVPLVYPGYCQGDLSASSVAQVPPGWPRCPQCDLGAASMTQLPPVVPLIWPGIAGYH